MVNVMVIMASLLALQVGPFSGWPDNLGVVPHPQETALANVRKLTFGGQNAEAYWNYEGTKIVFQSRQPGFPDEQIFTMNADGSGRKLVSTGDGRCTCSFFLPNDEGIVFSSTHAKNKHAQEPVDMSKGYVWKVNPQFGLYKTDLDGKNMVTLLEKDAYVAETTVAPDGSYMTFTSDFEGDLEIYRSNLDGSDIQRLTHNQGYDGGPFISWDGNWIVFRRDLIESDQEREDYLSLLKEHMVRPSKLEIWIMRADGSEQHQLTKLGCASFAPFLHPNGRTVIFASNYGDPRGREFNLWAVDVDGSNLRQVTFAPDFDGFPMFTADGKRLVWASNREGKVPGETNIFTADWVAK